MRNEGYRVDNGAPMFCYALAQKAGVRVGHPTRLGRYMYGNVPYLKNSVNVVFEKLGGNKRAVDVFCYELLLKANEGGYAITFPSSNKDFGDDSLQDYIDGKPSKYKMPKADNPKKPAKTAAKVAYI
jgi:hypothetical protein